MKKWLYILLVTLGSSGYLLLCWLVVYKWSFCGKANALAAVSACMSAFCSFIGLFASCYAIHQQFDRDKPHLATDVYSIPDDWQNKESKQLIVVKVSNIGVVPFYISSLTYCVKKHKRSSSGRHSHLPAFPIPRESKYRFCSREDLPIELTPFRSVFFAIPANQAKQTYNANPERFSIRLEDGTSVLTKQCKKLFGQGA